jgi:hypothetical protein
MQSLLGEPGALPFLKPPSPQLSCCCCCCLTTTPMLPSPLPSGRIFALLLFDNHPCAPRHPSPRKKIPALLLGVVNYPGAPSLPGAYLTPTAHLEALLPQVLAASSAAAAAAVASGPRGLGWQAGGCLLPCTPWNLLLAGHVPGRTGW